LRRETVAILFHKQKQTMAQHRLTEAGPGRPKGIPNKITLSVREAIERAFDNLGGASYLEHVGRSDPRTFCALLSKLLPTKLSNADGSPLLAALTELTDAQLEARTTRALADAQRAGLMGPLDGGSSAAVLEVQAEVVEPLQRDTEKENP
jgi:hypothetical protein